MRWLGKRKLQKGQLRTKTNFTRLIQQQQPFPHHAALKILLVLNDDSQQQKWLPHPCEPYFTPITQRKWFLIFSQQREEDDEEEEDEDDSNDDEESESQDEEDEDMEVDVTYDRGDPTPRSVHWLDKYVYWQQNEIIAL